MFWLQTEVSHINQPDAVLFAEGNLSFEERPFHSQSIGCRPLHFPVATARPFILKKATVSGKSADAQVYL